MKSDYFSESPAFTDFQTKLAQEFARLHSEIERLRQENATLTAERDEARREVCLKEAERFPTMADPHRDAKRRGWDCFKENTND